MAGAIDLPEAVVRTRRRTERWPEQLPFGKNVSSVGPQSAYRHPRIIAKSLMAASTFFPFRNAHWGFPAVLRALINGHRLQEGQRRCGAWSSRLWQVGFTHTAPCNL